MGFDHSTPGTYREYRHPNAPTLSARSSAMRRARSGRGRLAIDAGRTSEPLPNIRSWIPFDHAQPAPDRRAFHVRRVSHSLCKHPNHDPGVAILTNVTGTGHETPVSGASYTAAAGMTTSGTVGADDYSPLPSVGQAGRLPSHHLEDEELGAFEQAYHLLEELHRLRPVHQPVVERER